MITIADFAIIKDKFAQQLKIQEAWIDPTTSIISRKINISNIRLGVAKVKNIEGYYEMIPVWDFFGSSIDKYSKQDPGGVLLDENMEARNPEGQCFMTLNAMDGKIIDRESGY